MITAARAEGYVRVWAFRTGEATVRGEDLRAIVFGLCRGACEAARLAASHDPIAALLRIGDSLLEEHPYG